MKIRYLLVLVVTLFLFAHSVSASPPIYPEQASGFKIDDFRGAEYILIEKEPGISGTEDLYQNSITLDPNKAPKSYEDYVTQERLWNQIYKEFLLRPNMMINTMERGYARIALWEDSHISLSEKTQIELTQKTLDKATIRQFFGKIYVKWNSYGIKKKSLEIKTSAGDISLTGTEIEVISDENESIVNVFKGSVKVDSVYDNISYIVREGESINVLRDKAAEKNLISDNTSLELTLESPCKEVKEYVERVYSQSYYTSEKNESLIPYNCLLEGRKFVFNSNKFLESSTVNERTFLVFDKNNKFIEGFINADDSISFISSAPLSGKIKVLLKGGKNGICSKTKACLKEDIGFEINNTDRTVYPPPRLTFAHPIMIIREFVIDNKGDKTAKNISVSFKSFGTYFPNAYVKFKNVTPDVPYREYYENENSFIEFKIKEIPAKTALKLYASYAGLLFGKEYFDDIDVSGLRDYPDSEIKDIFTKPEENVESNDTRIIELSRKIVGEEKNPFWKAYKIYNWITDSIVYDYEKANADPSVCGNFSGGALQTIISGKGVCDDYSKLFIAMCRAVGIPARIDTGFPMLGNFDAFSTGRHAIAEFYVPEYGWIPVDPTWGAVRDYFARQIPYFFIEQKQDRMGNYHAYPHYNLSGENTENLTFSVAYAKFEELKPENEEDWNNIFGDPFYRDIYSLVAISEIEDEIDSLQYYNDAFNYEIFKMPRLNRSDTSIAMNNAINAHKNKNYKKVEADVHKTISKDLKSSIEAVIILTNLTQQEIGAPYNLTPIIDYFGINLTINQSETESRISDAGDRLNRANELIEMGKDDEAINEFNTALSEMWPLFNRFKRNIIETSLNKRIPTNPELITAIVLFFITILLSFLFFFFIFILFIWMLIHCIINKEFNHLNKFWWILIILFIFVIGPILYFILEYLRRDKKKA